MKHSEEKIIEALTVIKEVCEESKDCSSCPLRLFDTHDTDCIFDNYMPEDLTIVEPESIIPRRLTE